jgi:PHD/YefM family antitoxin component YafN of YafNO toxin-antitoxin module
MRDHIRLCSVSRSTTMRCSSRVKPVGDLEAHAAEVLRHLAEQREPVVIAHNGEAKGVLQDVASLGETQETPALPGDLALGQQDVEPCRVRPVADGVARLRAKRATA